jgi:hypothetical protein
VTMEVVRVNKEYY